MKVLVITGDKNFKESPRFALQATQVEKLEVVYWGRGSMRPELPIEKFDVVTAQDPFWRGLFAWRAARRMGAKLNIQVHTDLAAQPLLRHVLGQIILRHADSVRVVSENLRTQVEHMGITVPIHVLPIYIDISRFKPSVRPSKKEKTILWIGRFEDEKDPLRAIRVFKEVHRQNKDTKLVLLGKGSLETELREEAKGLPVEFPGWQDPVQYLAEADVVLSTSKHESYGASIIESLAAGVAVVAPDVGVAREAGAIIRPYMELGDAVLEVLQTGSRGELKLWLPTAEKWAEDWKKSLI